MPNTYKYNIMLWRYIQLSFHMNYIYIYIKSYKVINGKIYSYKFQVKYINNSFIYEMLLNC